MAASRQEYPAFKRKKQYGMLIAFYASKKQELVSMD